MIKRSGAAQHLLSLCALHNHSLQGSPLVSVHVVRKLRLHRSWSVDIISLHVTGPFLHGEDLVVWSIESTTGSP